MSLLFATLPAVAQISADDLRLPISLEAESTNYDGKTSMLMFKGLRLTQGSLGVRADDGRASKLDFEDSLWRFSGNVVIDTDTGHIECDTADLRFTDHQLVSATIVGSPATFEMLRPEHDDMTRAEAGKLYYDFKLGVVEFTENATISEGGNQLSSDYLVYNIAEQRINAQSAGKNGDRVKITYTPSPAGAADPPQNIPDKDPGQAGTNEQSTIPSSADKPSDEDLAQAAENDTNTTNKTGTESDSTDTEAPTP